MKVHGQTESVRKEREDYLKDQMPRPMIMSDAQPRDTHVLIRGSICNLGESYLWYTRLSAAHERGLVEEPFGPGTGWCAPEQPLTSRVQVHRMWQHFLERVSSRLLKILASKRIPRASGSSELAVRRFPRERLGYEAAESIHRNRATYRQSSRMTEDHRSTDPENRLYGRAARLQCQP